MTKSFGSDNHSGAHPAVLEALARANEGHAHAYGDDEHTARAVALFRERFGRDVDVYFVLTGTSANVLGLDAVTRSYHSVLCAETAHLERDECGAPEHYLGCKLVNVSTGSGKIAPSDLEPHLGRIGFEHASQPRVVSISQATELGTVYTVRELEALAEFAHENDLLLHVDGARLANAAVHLGVGLAEITAEVGVDVLSFGGTKNGAVGAEAVVFFDPKLSRDFKYVRKQGMQLVSKMRFVAAQFEALLEDDLWSANARHANDMAARLGRGLDALDGFRVVQPVESNGVFVEVPGERVFELMEASFFYIWEDDGPIARLMTSWDTDENDVDAFVRVAASGPG